MIVIYLYDRKQTVALAKALHKAGIERIVQQHGGGSIRYAVTCEVAGKAKAGARKAGSKKIVRRR